MDIRSLLCELQRTIEKSQNDPVRRMFPAVELPRLPEHREAGKRAAVEILRNEADAEEAVDQAIGEIALQPDEPPNTRAAVVNKSRQRAIDRYRKKKRQRTEANTETANAIATSRSLTPHDEVEVAEFLELLEDAILTLPPNDQPAASLYFRSGYSVQEISRELKIDYQTVYRSLARSRPKLLEKLPGEYHDQLRPFPERVRGLP